MELEQWAPIPGFVNYEASTHGRIRRIDTGYCPALQRGRGGYYTVRLFPGRKHRYVHALVARTFLGPRRKRQVNHRNGIKTDNAVTNLEWVTASANRLHAFAVLNQRRPSGSIHGMHKLDEDTVLCIRNAYATAGRRTIKQCSEFYAALFGVSVSTVRKILERRTWRHI